MEYKKVDRKFKIDNPHGFIRLDTSHVQLGVVSFEVTSPQHLVENKHLYDVIKNMLNHDFNKLRISIIREWHTCAEYYRLEEKKEDVLKLIEDDFLNTEIYKEHGPL